MKPKFTDTEIQALEKQLSCPEGEAGIELGKTMHASNIGMTEATIDFLDIKSLDNILELGHGNCHHLPIILNKGAGVRYYGLEVSETMYQEAICFDTSKQASFALYNGIEIPFEDNFFQAIMTVNTIYFWSDPLKLIREIERVLKVGGKAVITFADKDFMQKLPFVKERFTLYDATNLEALVTNSGLKVIDVLHKVEQVTSKTGNVVDRKFTLFKVCKE